MSEFVDSMFSGALAEARDRREKLRAFIEEAKELDLAIAELEKAHTAFHKKRPKPTVVQRQLPPPVLATPKGTGGHGMHAGGDQPSERALREQEARVARPHPPVAEGSNLQKAIAVLANHPHGLSTTAIGNEAGMPSGSVSVVLQQGADRGLITKVGRGFWRLPG